MTWKKTFKTSRKMWKKHPTSFNFTSLILILVGLIYRIDLVSVIAIFVLRAPSECLAINRDGETRCRNNTLGLVGGCKLNSHKRLAITERLKPRTGATNLGIRRGQLVGCVNLLGATGSTLGGIPVIISLVSN